MYGEKGKERNSGEGVKGRGGGQRKRKREREKYDEIMRKIKRRLKGRRREGA